MITIPADVFIRLSLSAKKNKRIELKTRTESKHVDVFHDLKDATAPVRYEPLSAHTPSTSLSASFSQTSSSKNIEKLDEKIVRIVDNPLLHAIRDELVNAESLYIGLKKDTKHKNNLAIARIGKKIESLKKLIEQKSYI